MIFLFDTEPEGEKTFEKIGYPENVSKVLGVLCCLYRHLPQGAPTSPALSNIVGYEMDKKLAALAAEYGLTYTRYADDLTFREMCSPKNKSFPGSNRSSVMRNSNRIIRRPVLSMSMAGRLLQEYLFLPVRN